MLNQIFEFYDKVILGLPAGAQFFVSVILLFVLIWSFISIFRQGHWIFIMIFILLVPGGWPAAKSIGLIIWSVVKFLIVRIQINM